MAKVLLAEEDAAMCELNRLHLAKKNHSVDAVSNEYNFLSLINENQYDVAMVNMTIIGRLMCDDIKRTAEAIERKVPEGEGLERLVALLKNGSNLRLVGTSASPVEKYGVIYRMPELAKGMDEYLVVSGNYRGEQNQRTVDEFIDTLK
jgi:CheY-like chemotaxis protein